MSKNFNTAVTEKSTTVWLTPPQLLGQLGDFDLDPCAAFPRPWDCARYNYTREDNGLLRPWFGRVWCNPPYGREAAPFIRRMAEHGRGLALIFVRTETSLWQDVILQTARAILFIRRRVYFCTPDGGQPTNGANAASCLIAWDEAEIPLLRGLEQAELGKLVIL